MNITLATINSSYSHSGLAISYLKTYLESSTTYRATNLEFTSEDSIEGILEVIFETNPKVLGLSCYIWNITKMHELSVLVKKVLPKVVIIAGGPEVSYTPKSILNSNLSIDYAISGDGERCFSKLVSAIDRKDEVTEIDGITFRDGPNIVSNEPDFINIDLIPSPYKHETVPFDKPVLHYETSRGCIFRCAFCTSAIDKEVREFSLERVFSDLKTISKKGVTYINVLDRSFAANKDRALKIMTFMRDEMPHVNFHFEINPHLFDDTMFDFLKTLRNRRFQFEMGIQSTDSQTRENINISYSAEKTNIAIKKLNEIGTVKLYLDLISGLPGESVDMFSASFNTLMEFEPETCQIETLKLLPGTPIRKIATERGYKYNEVAPYKILSTDTMDFSDIAHIEKIKTLVDKVYNKGWLKRTIKNIRDNHYESYWDLFQDLKSFWCDQNLLRLKLSKRTTFIAMKQFLYSNKLLDVLPLFYFEAALNFKTGIDGMDDYKQNHPKAIKDKSFWEQTLKDNFHELYFKKAHKYTSFYIFPINPENLKKGSTKVLVVHPLQDGNMKKSKYYLID